jgi:hypothetical protein
MRVVPVLYTNRNALSSNIMAPPRRRASALRVWFSRGMRPLPLTLGTSLFNISGYTVAETCRRGIVPMGNPRLYRSADRASASRWSAIRQATELRRKAHPSIRFLLTGLTRSNFQTPLCLRQHGTGQYICVSFFALRAKKRNTSRRKSTTANDQYGQRICPVIG